MRDPARREYYLRAYPLVVGGSPGDGVIYVSKKGELVKLDKRSHAYRVREDGWRDAKNSKPHHWSRELWDGLTAAEKREVYRAMKAEEDAKAKADAAWETLTPEEKVELARLVKDKSKGKGKGSGGGRCPAASRRCRP
jgi:hypothetical protein